MIGAAGELADRFHLLGIVTIIFGIIAAVFGGIIAAIIGHVPGVSM